MRFNESQILPKEMDSIMKESKMSVKLFENQQIQEAEVEEQSALLAAKQMAKSVMEGDSKGKIVIRKIGTTPKKSQKCDLNRTSETII